MYGTTIGTPMGSVITNPINTNTNVRPVNTPVRGVNYIADYGGCGHWRMLWPSHHLQATQQAIIHNTSTMITSENYYKDVDTIRVQRQVTKSQFSFFKILKKIASAHNIRIVYEIDDVFIYDDIPKYNKLRSAYSDPEIMKCGIAIMQECDEVTVTCEYMKEYYSQYCDRVTVIPNYMPKHTYDRFYCEDKLALNYNTNVKKRRKPRVVYAASGCHFDTTGQNKYRDDFEHVNDVIRRTVSDFQWVFLGAFPIPLRDLIQSKKIEFHPWVSLPGYVQKIIDLKPNAMIAPLTDNIFNRCKSDLKFIESSALGIPVVCQDLITYDNAHIKFTTGDDMIAQLNTLFTDKSKYMTHCRNARKYAETRWLDDHIDKYYELYKHSYKHADRKSLNLIQM